MQEIERHLAILLERRTHLSGDLVAPFLIGLPGSQAKPADDVIDNPLVIFLDEQFT
jgi:hypothetical protein